jgi:hypothetical protein
MVDCCDTYRYLQQKKNITVDFAKSNRSEEHVETMVGG